MVKRKRHFDHWLKAYVAYCDYSEAPTIFHLWTGISTIAGALRRHVWLDMGYFTWTPNLLVVLVAPPGIVQKSSTISIGMDMLKEIPGIRFGPNSVTWQALVSSLSDACETFELPDGSFMPMSAITIASSEFGTFLDPRNRDMVDLIVDLWDGKLGVWERHTRTQGQDRIVNPWINIIACTTPAWIADNFPKYMIDGGFTSRTIFVYAEQKRKLIAYPKKLFAPEVRRVREMLIEDLKQIGEELVGEFELTEEATEWGQSWYENLHTKVMPELEDERLAGYLARKQTHLHKIAMIVAAAKRNEPLITKEDLEEADKLLAATEIDMTKVFEQISEKDVRLTNQIVQHVLKQGRVPLQKLYLRFMHEYAFKDFEEAVRGAIHSGKVRQMVIDGVLYLCRS